MALIEISTGIKSTIKSVFDNTVLVTPLPHATMRPIGPLKLSIHPFTGSLAVDITKRKIPVTRVQLRYILNNFNGRKMYLNLT